MTADHLVFKTNYLDATAADIEQWAADRGCIVSNIRRIDAAINYHGKQLTPADDYRIWVADIVLSEGIQ